MIGNTNSIIAIIRYPTNLDPPLSEEVIEFLIPTAIEKIAYSNVMPSAKHIHKGISIAKKYNTNIWTAVIDTKELNKMHPHLINCKLDADVLFLALLSMTGKSR